jgi:transcriptional regulator with XRE-family HTH domain
MYAGASVRYNYSVDNRGMAKKVIPRLKRPVYQRTFIRQWREHRELTLEALGERIGMSHVSLSRIERGLQPYSQPVLEAIAKALRTDAASLIMRNPEEPGIWSIWDNASQGDQRKIIEIARTITGRTGTQD